MAELRWESERSSQGVYPLLQSHGTELRSGSALES